MFERVKQTAEKRACEILVVNAGDDLRRDMENVAVLEGVDVTYAASAVEALDSVQNPRSYDCVVVGAGESEVSAADLLVELQKASSRDLELIAYTPEEGPPAGSQPGAVPRRHHRALGRFRRPVAARSRPACSTSPKARCPSIKAAQAGKAAAERSRTGGQPVLIVDDDVRNIFALDQHPGAPSDPGSSCRKRPRGNRIAGAIAGDRYRA